MAQQTSKLLSLLFSVIFISFGITVSYTLSQLNRSLSAFEYYVQEKDKIFTQINQPILNYLLSGEATILGKVSSDLLQIKTEIDKQSILPSAIKTSFISLLTDFQQSTMADLVAAGKLADPQMLLINNEQQLATYLQDLWKYAEDAPKASQQNKLRYFQLVGRAQAALINLAKARQSYFKAHKVMAPEVVTRHLNNLTTACSDLANLPLLGLMKAYKADENSFTLGKPAKTEDVEDKALEPIREIPYLINHYRKDFQLAQQVAQNKLTGQAIVNQQILKLQNQLLSLESQITTDYQNNELLMNIIVGGCSLLVLAAILI